MYQSMGLLLEKSLYKTFNILIFLARSPCSIMAKFLIHCLSCVCISSILLESKTQIYIRAGVYLDQYPQFAEKEMKLRKGKLLVHGHIANLVVELVLEL